MDMFNFLARITSLVPRRTLDALYRWQEMAYCGFVGKVCKHIYCPAFVFEWHSTFDNKFIFDFLLNPFFFVFSGKASEQALTEAMDHKNEPGNFYHGMCYPFLLPVKSCTRQV